MDLYSPFSQRRRCHLKYLAFFVRAKRRGWQRKKQVISPGAPPMSKPGKVCVVLNATEGAVSYYKIALYHSIFKGRYGDMED
jgi:hypothetical protein